jgi:hypothetical protein
MKVKTMAAPKYRFYSAQRGAKLRSGEKELVLKKNDLFRLTTFDGRPSVIKDGVVYHIDKRLVGELKLRSSEASVSKIHAKKIEVLDLYGIDIEKALVKNLASLIKELDGSDVEHGFDKQSVWLSFTTKAYNRNEPIQVVFSMNGFSIGVALYYTHQEMLSGWKALPLIEKACRLFSKFVSSKFSLTANKLTKGSATVANVKVCGKYFSGRTTYFSTKWEL